MEFEYNSQKSLQNLKKHGISLEDATQLWFARAVIVPARSIDEDRQMIVGEIGNKCYSCIFTAREKKIRLISARRSRMNEEEIYHGIIKKED